VTCLERGQRAHPPPRVATPRELTGSSSARSLSEAWAHCVTPWLLASVIYAEEAFTGVFGPHVGRGDHRDRGDSERDDEYL
jgi:hypothetical protein